jgi:cytidylate kinase
MEPRANNILQMVERQFRRFELLEEHRAKEKAETHWPVVTVGREFGARGEALGRVVAERLGFTFWDGELVHRVAEESGANEAVLRSLDEHRRTSIEESIDGALLGGQHMASEYLRRLMKLIHTLSTLGSSVVVGRGAQYVLAPEAALRLRVVCPFEIRVRRYAERRAIDESLARNEVERAEAERRRFVRQFFSRDPESPSDYDLVLNSGTFELDRAADVVLEAYEAKFGRLPAPAPTTARSVETTL